MDLLNFALPCLNALCGRTTCTALNPALVYAGTFRNLGWVSKATCKILEFDDCIGMGGFHLDADTKDCTWENTEVLCVAVSLAQGLANYGLRAGYGPGGG